MNPSSDLFFLIKSLTKNEKRYFRLNASLQKGDKKYLRLFDAIAEQEVYDEAKILREGKGYITRMNLLKSSLYEKIMNSLDAFHENDSADKWIKKQIRQTDILYKKRLYLQALKVVKKTKRVSEKYQKHASHVELLLWEYELLKFLPDIGNLADSIKNIFMEIDDYVARYRNYIDYRTFSSTLFSFRIHMGHSRSATEENVLKKIISDPRLSSENKTKSYPALFYYYSSYIAYYGFTNDERKKLVYTKKAVELFEQFPHEIEENIARYVSVIHNHINCLLSLRNYNELVVFLEHLKKIKAENDLAKNMIEHFVTQIELFVFVGTCELDKAQKLVSRVEKQIRTSEFNPPNKQVEVLVYYYCMQYYIYVGNFKSANYFINKIIHFSSHNIRDDVYCFAKIIQLIVYYEMEETELLESSIKSTYRYLFKKERNYKFESLVLSFFRKNAPGIISQKHRNSVFKELKKEIELLLEDPYEKTIVSYFDFVSWLEGKISEKNFAEVVKRKRS